VSTKAELRCRGVVVVDVWQSKGGLSTSFAGTQATLGGMYVCNALLRSRSLVGVCLEGAISDGGTV
jgi:hypothetical protein